MDPSHCTIHIVSFPKYKYKEGIENTEEGDPLPFYKEYIQKHFPNLIKDMKRGDMIENINDDSYAYRSGGIYFIQSVDKESMDLLLVSKDTEYDDYGYPPSIFKILEEFPMDYFEPHNCNVNNIYFPNKYTELYWHAHCALVTIDLKYFIKRNRLAVISETKDEKNKLHLLRITDYNKTYVVEVYVDDWRTRDFEVFVMENNILKGLTY